MRACFMRSFLLFSNRNTAFETTAIYILHDNYILHFPLVKKILISKCIDANAFVKYNGKRTLGVIGAISAGAFLIKKLRKH